MKVETKVKADKAKQWITREVEVEPTLNDLFLTEKVG